ncbi:MAG: pyridoxal phosphate-dependent aminotransferase [Myxococcota bacterium]
MPRSHAARNGLLQPSATVAVAQRARELKAQGIDVLSFSVGEPDFDTPAHIAAAAKKAIDEGKTRYTAAKGVPELLDAVCARSKVRRGTDYGRENVVCSVGAKHVLFNLALVLYEAGDEVVVPAPYWVSYPEQVRYTGAEPVVVETTMADGFRMTPAQLEAALSPKTKAVILCSPSNPTGSAYSEAQLRALTDVLAKHDCWIIVDEIYGELVYDGFEQKSVIEVAPELADRIILVDGVAKTYAMTGWRIGWMLGPASVAKDVNKLQGQATTNPTTPAQYAVVEALTGPQDAVAEMLAAFTKRRSLIVDGINAIEGLSCRMPEGAFYAFTDVSAHVGKSAADRTLANDIELAGYLLEEARCAVVPGTAFGAPGHVRISYACSEAQIEEGLSRIAAALAKLR